MRTMTRLLAVLLLCTATVVWAGAPCLYSGVLYPEGTHIGSLVCVDGKWR
jgi:hypothetical protein